MPALGLGTSCYVLDTGLISDTIKRVQRSPTFLTAARAASYQLITGGVLRLANAAVADAVVGGTKTWTFANGAFAAADVGGVLIVIGSALNDGVYNITARTSATVIVTDGAPVNEAFTTAATFYVFPPGTLAGTWAVEVSNDYAPKNGGSHGQAPTLGREHWTDITAQFASPSIVTVDPAVAATRNQFAQAAPIAARAMRVSFTPTSGAGTALAIVGGGDY